MAKIVLTTPVLDNEGEQVDNLTVYEVGGIEATEYARIAQIALLVASAQRLGVAMDVQISCDLEWETVYDTTGAGNGRCTIIDTQTFADLVVGVGCEIVRYIGGTYDEEAKEMVEGTFDADLFRQSLPF